MLTVSVVRAMIREALDSALGGLVQITKWAYTTSSGLNDSTDGHRTQPNEPTYHYPTRRMQHFGYRSRPPDGVDAVRVHSSGGQGQAIGVAEDSETYGPSDLETGETALYNLLDDVLIKLDKDGNILIRIATDSGKNVFIDDGDGSGANKLATKADIDALANWIKTHIHSGGTMPQGVTGVPSPADVPAAAGTVVLKAR